MDLNNKNNVLIIGYGCAGRIHEKIWQKKGYNISYIDINWTKISHKKNSYKSLEDFFSANKRKDFIYDICCDTEDHLDVLKIIKRFRNRADVIIEKPVVDSREALEEFVDFFKTHKNIKIFINENYFFSETLQTVKKKIKEYDIESREIYIEFSKDRKVDITNNRFIDKKLGVFGIEFPHMLAIISYLDFNKDLKISDVKYEISYHLKNKHINFLNNGIVRLVNPSKKMVCNLCSSLTGNIFYKTNIERSKFFNKRFRLIEIKSEAYKIMILWEPLRNKERLCNRIIIKHKNKTIEDSYIHDNTMLNSLNCAEKYFKSGEMPYKPLISKCCRMVGLLNKFLKYDG